MKKIASPAELQTELRTLLAEAASPGVSRGIMASKLRALAERVADSAGDASKLKTKDLYTKTLELLRAKKFGPARAHLDELSTRKDNKKEIPSAESLHITGPYADILQDRIELVNSKTAEAKYDRRFAASKYILESDGESPMTVALDDFLKDNEEGLDSSEVRAIKNLRPGQSYEGGGGAAPEWKITRKS